MTTKTDKQQTTTPEGKGRSQHHHRDEQFVKMYSDLIDLPISDGAKVTFIKLLEYDFKYPHVFPGYDTLSKERQGRSVASIKRDIQEVEALGLVVVVNTGRANYYLIWNWLPADGAEFEKRREDAMDEYNKFKDEKRKRKEASNTAPSSETDSSSVSYRAMAHTRTIRKRTSELSDSSSVSQDHKSIDNKNIDISDITTAAIAADVVVANLQAFDTNISNHPNSSSTQPTAVKAETPTPPNSATPPKKGRVKIVPPTMTAEERATTLASLLLEQRRFIELLGHPVDFEFPPSLLKMFDVWRTSLGADDAVINYAFDEAANYKAGIVPNRETKTTNWVRWLDSTIRNQIQQRYDKSRKGYASITQPTTQPAPAPAVSGLLDLSTLDDLDNYYREARNAPRNGYHAR